MINSDIMKRFFKYHFAFYFLMIAIFVQSSFPSVELPSLQILNTDKIVHIIAFAVLGLFCYISFVNQDTFRVLFSYPMISTFIFVAIYGASDEYHQTFVTNRSGEIADWIADIIGLILIIIIIKYFLKKNYILFKRKAEILN